MLSSWRRRSLAAGIGTQGPYENGTAVLFGLQCGEKVKYEIHETYIDMSKTQLGRDTSGPYETPTSRKLATKRFLQKRPVQASLILVLAAVIVFSWQLLNNTANSTDPTSAGHPLSNPHTHLHTIALGVRPGTLYLGTHFGVFTSTDGGKSWPQPRGALNTMMIRRLPPAPLIQIAWRSLLYL